MLEPRDGRLQCEWAGGLILLALLLSWSAVTLDCQGGQEPRISYLVVSLDVRVPGRHLTPEGILVPDYDRRLDFYCTDDLSITVPDLREPGVDEMVYLSEPIACDRGGCTGNRSDDPCP